MMNKKMLLSLSLFLIIIAIGVTGQATTSPVSCHTCAVIQKLSEILGSLNQIHTDIQPIANDVPKILDELEIINNKKSGEVVTGVRILRDGLNAPKVPFLLVNMPLGSCDVAISGNVSPPFGVVNSYEAKITGETKNGKGCGVNPADNTFGCIHQMTFDNQYRFYKAVITASDSGFVYFLVAYQCTLS